MKKNSWQFIGFVSLAAVTALSVGLALWCFLSCCKTPAPGMSAPLTEQYQDDEIIFKYPNDLKAYKNTGRVGSSNYDVQLIHKNEYSSKPQPLMLDVRAKISRTEETMDARFAFIAKEGMQVKYQNPIEMKCGKGLEIVHTYALTSKTVDVTEYLFENNGKLYVLSGQGSVTPDYLDDIAHSFKFIGCK